MDNLWSLLERSSRNFPEALALRFPAGKRYLTWLDLKQAALALARELQGRGIEKGDRVGLFLPNTPEFVISFFAASYLGAVVVPINGKLTAPEISYILADSGAKALLYAADKGETVKEAVEKAGVGVLLADTDFPLQDAGGDSDYREGGYAEAADLAEILYTSGTTGRPKGVMLTNYAVIAVGQMMAYEAQIYHGDNVLLLMPLTHSAPLNLFVVGAVWAGAQMTLGEFTPQALLQLAAGEGATHFFGAPVAYQLLCRMPNLAEYDLSAMKLWIYGGAPIGREQVLNWQKLLPGKFMSVYGLTEAGPNGLALRPAEHAVKAGSIGGRGSINTAVKIVREDGREAGPGETGEIALKTASVMLGYYNNSGATASALRENWLLTGDVALKDEDGYVWILDRKKDMIISGGVNVYPKEIEDLLLTHPQVADVAVIGVPHPDWGESVCAVVVPHPGGEPSLETIRQFCQGKLADYKVPKLLRLVPALPRNSSGKLLKYELRAERA